MEQKNQPLDQETLIRYAEELKQANEALVLAGLREQELAERTAELYEQAQRAIQSREDLLAIVSHDLRDPLGVMLMNLHLLLKASGPNDRRKSRKQLESLKRSAERMNHLIQNLLDAAIIETGRFSIEQQRLELVAFITEAVEALHPLAMNKAQHLVIDLPPALPAVWADPVRLQQVFSNLLGNAIKFTPKNGRITLRAEPCEDAVTCSITDTGPGIAEADIPHLFDRFWQADLTARLGSGLGLFIVKGIMEAHRGRIWVESHIGVGSTFFFTLPLAPRETERL